MTTTNSWLPLAEYSMKHHVSISTLRRRIKADDINFRFDDGKYFILDEAPVNERLAKKVQAEEHRPSLSREAKASTNSTENTQISQQIVPEKGESVITAANKLLVDLKKAYTLVLQEKEEQIMHLKEEIVDLKTLIKVLETENSRLRDLQYDVR
jgi:hypothetical protein